jgi:uncharacterized membrane protein YfcA
LFLEILDMNMALGGIVALFSAMIMGYAGFGGGLIIVPILAILFSPVEAIAMVVAAAPFGNVMLLPDALKKAEWREAIPLSIGLAVAIPIGLMFLISAEPVLIRRAMGIFILVSSAILITGWTYPGKRGVFTSLTAGVLAGGVTGGVGIPGGPFMVLYYLSAPVESSVQRANIIVSRWVGISFLLVGLISQGAYTPETLWRVLILVPLYIGGTKAGQYIFKIAPATWFKKVTYGILIVMGVTMLLV